MVLNGIGYRVSAMNSDKDLRQWVYDLKEIDGDGVLTGMLQSVLVAFSKYVAPDGEALMDKLDTVRQDLERIRRSVADELTHVQAMMQCSVFNSAAQDLARIHRTLGGVNSVRVWIDNAVTAMSHILMGEEVGDVPKED